MAIAAWRRLRRWSATNKADILIATTLALLPALFFWRLIAPAPIDRLSISTGDFTDQYYPLRSFAAASLADGEWPLWNPSAYGGQPALADIQSGALYPPQMAEVWVLRVLGLGFPVWALELQVIAHFSWAALGAYFLGKRLCAGRSRVGRDGPGSGGKSRLVGVVVSLVFTYSGYMTGFPVQQLTILEVSAWLPWVLLALDGVASRVNQGVQGLARPVTLAGLALGMALLPGHPQTYLYVVYLAVAYFAWRLFAGDGAPSPVRAAAVMAVVFGSALCLTAAQWLPTVEFIVRSPRADMSYPAVSQGLPLAELVSIVYPGYFGGSPEYVGIVALVLIALALGFGKPRREVLFWSVVAILALVLAFGGNTFLYSLFYLLGPGFRVVRQQERAFLIFAMSAAVMAGYGAAALLAPRRPQDRIRFEGFRHSLWLVFGIGVALTFPLYYGWMSGEHRDLFGGVLRHHVFGLILLAGCLVLLAWRANGWLRRGWAMGILVAWIAFDGFSVNWCYNLEQPSGGGVFGATPAVTFLQQQQAAAPQPFRIAGGGLLPGGSGAASVFGLQDITGNTPLHLASWEGFETTVPEWRRWQLLNVRYVLSDRDIGAPGLTQVFSEPADADEPDAPGLRIFEMGDAFPRAWVVHAWETVPDVSQALSRVAQDGFDLRSTAVLDADVGLIPPGTAAGSQAMVGSFTAKQILLHVDARADGVVVVGEVCYPGWQAWVDGVRAPTVCADGILRGIPVRSGAHEVELRYAPASFRIGLVLSCVTVLAVLLAWLSPCFRRGSRPPARTTRE